MSNLTLLLICFVLGIALRASGRFPPNAHQTLNAVILNVALPAMVLAHVHRIGLDSALAQAVASAWFGFGIAVGVFLLAGRLLALERATVGALILTGGLANTSFVGVPMIEAFYGRDSVGIGVVIDTLGSYLILSTLGIAVAAIAVGGSFDYAATARRILTFPPLLAIALAIALRPVEFPGWLEASLLRLSDLVAPLALLSVGMQLRLSAIAGNLKGLVLGLTYKLVLGPALIAVSFLQLFGGPGDVLRIALFEAAMPPMIGAAVLAADSRLNPPLVALMVGIGIPLSFLTVPLWWWVLS